MQAATKSQSVTSGAVGADEVVPYGAVIEAIDTMKAGGVSSVALAAN